VSCPCHSAPKMLKSCRWPGKFCERSLFMNSRYNAITPVHGTDSTERCSVSSCVMHSVRVLNSAEQCPERIIKKKTIIKIHLPLCIVGDRCLCPNVPLNGRHYCALCKKQLHGPCSVFNGDESAITYCNRCFSCPSATEDFMPTATVSASVEQTSATSKQFNVISSKDVDPKKISWNDIVAGDKPSTKLGDNGAMVKSIATICGIDAMTSTEQLHLICSSMKLSGYSSKPKAELLWIIGIGKIHQSLSHFSEDPSKSFEPKTPAKTHNCVFCLLNILFSDEMSPKFLQLGVRKHKSILDSGLAGNDEYFWQEVADKFQEANLDYDELAHKHQIFSWDWPFS